VCNSLSFIVEALSMIRKVNAPQPSAAATAGVMASSPSSATAGADGDLKAWYQAIANQAIQTPCWPAPDDIVWLLTHILVTVLATTNKDDHEDQLLMLCFRKTKIAAPISSISCKDMRFRASAGKLSGGCTPPVAQSRGRNRRSRANP